MEENEKNGCTEDSTELPQCLCYIAGIGTKRRGIECSTNYRDLNIIVENHISVILLLIICI